MNLHQAAQRLGVHYMTAYRYVRLGELPAVRRGGRWVVERSDVDAMLRHRSSPRDSSETAGRRRPAVLRERLLGCLLAGDEPGAWTVIERALAGGYTPADLYLQLLAPCLRTVGDRWAAGTLSVGDEHTASAVAARLVGRLGPRFVRRGRNHGAVVVGAAPGDPHSLPLAMLTDLLRGNGYRVVDLGANAPVESFLAAARATERLVAVGVSVSDATRLRAAAQVVRAVRRALPVAVLVGGPAVDEAAAGTAGADGWAADGRAAAELLDGLRRRR